MLVLAPFVAAELADRSTPWFWVLTALLVLVAVYPWAMAGWDIWLARRATPPRRARTSD